MKQILKQALLIGALAVTGYAMQSCSDPVDYTKPAPKPGERPTVVTVSVSEGDQVDPMVLHSIQINFDDRVAINQYFHPTINGENITPAFLINDGVADHTTILLPVILTANTTYKLQVPEGAFLRVGNNAKNEYFEITFNTGDAGSAPIVADLAAITNKNATPQAKALYDMLVENYGDKMLSGAMGEVGWGLGYTDFLKSQVGVYPAIVGFDYIHMCWSAPDSWINYGNISDVQKVWEAGSIPAFSWHWNVPKADAGQSTTTIWEGSTAMGGWSNYVQLDASYFTNTTVGEIITVQVTDLGDNPQGSFKTASDGWPQITDGTEYFSIDGPFSLTIDADILAKLKSTGLVVGGQNYTATKVTITGMNTDVEYTFRTDTDFMPENILVDGTWENQVAEADVAKLAEYMKLLQDKGIAILWRPFHEAAGDYGWGAWFWWGKSGTDVTKQLYKWLRDKLEGQYGINNLVWVWTVQTSDQGKPADTSKILAAYPGDAYVDIVGADIYPDEQLTDQSATYNVLNMIVGGRKMVTLSECGNLIDPAKAKDNNALWSFFMQWYDMQDGKYGFFNYAGPDQWKTVTSSPLVLNQGDFAPIK